MSQCSRNIIAGLLLAIIYTMTHIIWVIFIYPSLQYELISDWFLLDGDIYTKCPEFSSWCSPTPCLFILQMTLHDLNFGVIWSHNFISDSLRFENAAPRSYLGHIKIWPQKGHFSIFIFQPIRSDQNLIWPIRLIFCRFWSVPPCYCFTACDSCPKLSILGPIKFPAGKLLSCTTHLLH